MLQDLNEELQREIGQSFISKFKNYGQFDFEGHTIIVEYTQHLWFQAKLRMVHQFFIPKGTSFYSIKDSPNLSVFLKQIDAFKITEEEDALNISFLVQLNFEQSLKKDTFVAELYKFKNEKPHELRNIISTSMNKYQKHYSWVINNMPFENKINDVFHNDQAVIFLAKGCLVLHENEQLPHKVLDKKVFFNQQQNHEMIQLKETQEQIFQQLQKFNKRDQLSVDSIVNSIQSHKYFTFYNQKFLLVHYTIFLKVIEEQIDNQKTYKIDDTVVQQSGLFAVQSNDKHKLINLEGDYHQTYPQIIHLLGKQLANIMDPSKYMKIFTDTITHENINSNIDILELAQKFKLGSVLLYRSKLFTNLACVYLGTDLVITVVLDPHNKKNNKDDIGQQSQSQQQGMSDEQAQMRNVGETQDEEQKNDREQQIFQFSRFDEFIHGVKTIQEIRFKFQPYDKQELFDKALQMNKSSFKFNIYKQNSEHLAFELASGFRFSPQQNLLVNKLGEVFQNIFFSK